MTGGFKAVPDLLFPIKKLKTASQRCSWLYFVSVGVARAEISQLWYHSFACLMEISTAFLLKFKGLKHRLEVSSTKTLEYKDTQRKTCFTRATIAYLYTPGTRPKLQITYSNTKYQLVFVKEHKNNRLYERGFACVHGLGGDVPSKS